MSERARDFHIASIEASTNKRPPGANRKTTSTRAGAEVDEVEDAGVHCYGFSSCLSKFVLFLQSYRTTKCYASVLLAKELALAPWLSTLRLTAPTSCQPASAAAYTANDNYNFIL